jgi:Zn-dependent protease with chaperone function
MSTAFSLYPATPANVPAATTAASPAFKKEVRKVMFAIVLFFIVYAILVVLSVLLAVGCVYAGFAVITNSGHLLGIITGAGIISIGVMVCIFLIKFIFAVKKYDDSNTIQITAAEQPELFAFIRQLTVDTQTNFPKKIVVAPEVNAAVYYNDSFWSMLFPVKKNLNIGLGLVNALTISEFKAVMAHEFGHFSQRSMKLGSFVYNVNKVIYNMLFENRSFANALQSWSSIHGIIYIFAWITSKIVTAIQFILRGMYGFINKSYMGLSREMEFHADAVASSVSGHQSLITALRKLEITDLCYQSAITKANQYLKENKRLHNFYECHQQVMRSYAQEQGLPLQNDAPLAEENFFSKFQLSKINVKDQWASHPSRLERKEKLEEFPVPAENNTQSAWLLFKEAPLLQQQVTQKMYAHLPAEQQNEVVSVEQFKEAYQTQVEKFTLPAAYNGFYDDRQMPALPLEELSKTPHTVALTKESFNSLFNDAQLALVKSAAGYQQDVDILKAIINKQLITKSFDYGGIKMKTKEAGALSVKLEQEVTTHQQQLQHHEEKIFSFFYQLAGKKSGVLADDLLKQYHTHFANRKKVETFLAIAGRVGDALAPLQTGQSIPIEQAENIADELKNETITIKQYVKEWLGMGVYDENTILKKEVEAFVTSEYQYFSRPRFFDNEINSLHDVLSGSLQEIGAWQFINFKKILNTQWALVEELE